MNKDFKEYIPFGEKEFRQNQEKAINDILMSIDDGNKYTILNASVGFGKSLVAYVVARYFQDLGHYSYLCTGTKILQSQYINDFKDVVTIKGRSNFDCNMEPMVNCSNGLCQTMNNFVCDCKPILKDKWEFQGNPVSYYDQNTFANDYSEMCPYWFQKLRGIFNPITMLNYDYLISDTRFVSQLPHRKLLVCDEGHNIEKILMRQLELRFSPRFVGRETGFKFSKDKSISEWVQDLYVIADIYKEKQKKAKKQEKKKKYNERFRQFYSLAMLMEEDPDNWVFLSENISQHEIFFFKPIKVDKYTNMIFDIADHVLIMTGTVLKQDIFARDLGISDFKYIEVPSIIPASRRPIIKSFVGSMARSSVNLTMPNLIAKIKILADKHSDEKGVIHTFTYNISKRIESEFQFDDRFIFHSQANKEDKFNEFKEDNTNKILVSPVAFEGVDFPYDQARWQCICKDPFPNIGDKQIMAREHIDFEWIFRQRCLVLSQMYGRTNRAIDDYSVTYLLDSRLDSLLGPASLVTDYFLEALEGERYMDTFILNENAYEKLTKDNNRKDHSFDRMVEKQLLKDIEDGYDSLGKLRKAYKAFNSDAYKEVAPAIQRLLKHKAIRYKE